MSTPPRSPWDPGLQLERTTLAWLRTTLAFVVGMIVLLRLLGHANAVAAVVCGVLTLPLAAVVVFWLVWRRHVLGDRCLRARQPLPGGALPAAVAALSVLVACSGLVYVMVTA
ncbi:hypothetical protein GCM10011581_46310 [Saccharopolyspora subtropica]|uniref:DUF202 domain-containing protein n=1 Tax=Saccharopolyspora thermophila TaxID=89367 RepID=A0A917K809_9PSEU|nr:DUF202 domain-containing protein [Saccharopolyspora subtropica]GGJ04048.1 hypothetical protein GCM10011581_46310 [Saccharopolyspora subtropica]